MAADENAKRLARIGKLYDVLHELKAKEYEILDEIGHLVRGEPGMAEHLKQAIAGWEASWHTRYRSRYVWNRTIEIPQVKRLIKQLGVEELVARSVNYVANDDPYYLRARHGFGLFASQVNRFASASSSDESTFELTPPADCRHTPPCKSEQEHTRKRSSELRA